MAEDALLAAIQANDADAARRAIEGSKNLNKKIDGKTPVQRAAEAGADRALAALLDGGAKATGDKGSHPFELAAAKGHRAVMDLLVERQAAPPDVMESALLGIGRNGPLDLLKYILERYKPRVSGAVIRSCGYSRNPAVIHALADAGVDLNATETFNTGATTAAAFHGVVTTGAFDVIAAMLERGVDVNARDSWGRTPLMRLAAAASERDRDLENFRKLQESRGQAGSDTLTIGNVTQQAPRSGEAQLRLLLEHGANATAKDNFGNDALDHYRCETRRIQRPENPRIIELLSGAGARGDDATFRLFFVKAGDLETARAGIADGADVNRVMPHHNHSTPLTAAAYAGDLPLVDLLVRTGADVNKYDAWTTPLIRACERGHLEVARRLIEARADPFARDLKDRADDLPAMNAYEAADWARSKPLMKYLESIGADKAPVRPLEAKVHTWEDFEEVLIKTDVATAAAAIAKLIGGSATLDAYGKSFKPGKRAYVIARPRDMAWCNVLQLAPARKRFEDPRRNDAFHADLAKAVGSPVIAVNYSDTAGEAEALRFDPDGTTSRPLGPSDLEGSSQRLDDLAKSEKMVIAAFDLRATARKPVEISFALAPAAVFDDVALVSV